MGGIFEVPNSNLKVELVDSLRSSVGNSLIGRVDQLSIECCNDKMPGTSSAELRKGVGRKNSTIESINKV